MKPDIKMEGGDYKVRINLKDFNPYNPKSQNYEFSIRVYKAIIKNKTNETNATLGDPTAQSNLTVAKIEKIDKEVE